MVNHLNHSKNSGERPFVLKISGEKSFALVLIKKGQSNMYEE